MKATHMKAKMAGRHAFTLTEIAIVLGIIGLITGGIWEAYSHVSTNRKATQAENEIRYIVTKMHTLANTNPTVFNTLQSDPGCHISYKMCPASSCSPNIPIMPPFAGCPPAPPCGAQCYDPSAGCVQGALAPYAGGTETISNALATMGIFPSEMVSGTTAAPIYSSPWGPGVTLTVTATSGNECGLPTYAPLVAAAAAAAQAAALATGVTQSVAVNASNTGATYNFNGSFTLTMVHVPVAACTHLLMAYSNELLGLGVTSIRVGSYGVNNPTAADMTEVHEAGWCNGSGTGTVTLSMAFPTQMRN